MSARMVTQQRAGPLGKGVLLFSGGMDSLIMTRLLKPDVLLYVRSATAYDGRELACVQALLHEGALGNSQLHVVDGVLNLSRYERDDAIVPNRNAHLVLLASNYGEKIYVGAVSGDRSRDKDELFCLHMGALLNHLWDEQHWTARRDFDVLIPYKAHTKTQLVAAYLREGGAAASLLRSYSCYSGVQPCGVCKPCFRKWVALRNNDIEVPKNYFAASPLSAEWLPQVLPKIKAGTWRGAEDADIMRAVEQA